MINEFLAEIRNQQKSDEIAEALKLFPLLKIVDGEDKSGEVEESKISSDLNPEQDKHDDPATITKCEICLNYPPKYTCPKCSI